MSNAFVAILMGSDSDMPIMESTIDVLQSLGIRFEVNILSAHRTPKATKEYIADAEQRGCQVFVAAAGLAAHLAGTVAAHTLKPVVGVPLDAGGLGGMDSLLSTAQMPGGIPVACTAVGKAGAKNAGFLAAQMMAISDPTIYEALKQDRQKRSEAVLAKNAEVKKRFVQ